jgi:glutaredoxin 3
LVARTGLMTVPQIFIGTTSIGGFTDLDALQKAGGLQPLLDAAGIQRTDRA